ncbi:MAG: S24/S26 family peptidase [bacterium]
MNNKDRKKNEDKIFLESVALELLKDALDNKSCLRISIGGTSMLPFIKDSDEIYIERNKNLPQVGDIIVYKSDSSIVAHRVIKIDIRGRVYTKGDNRLRIEGPIEIKDIIGKVIKTSRNNKNLFKMRIKNRYIAQISLISGLIYRIIVENKIVDFKGRFTSALRLILNSPLRILR